MLQFVSAIRLPYDTYGGCMDTKLEEIQVK
jgi:hypothetical protein